MSNTKATLWGRTIIDAQVSSFDEARKILADIEDEKAGTGEVTLIMSGFRRVLGFEMRDDGPHLYGLPLDLEWWKARASAEVREQLVAFCEWVEGTQHGGIGAFFGLTLGALAEVRAWEKAGIQIKGLSWADVGGCEGYYALALKLAGAERVRLVEPYPISKHAAEALEEAGVEVVQARGEDADLTGFDGAVVLYVPDIFEECLLSPKGVRQIIRNTPEFPDDDLGAPQQSFELPVDVEMGEGQAEPFVKTICRIELVTATFPGLDSDD
jgi:hypothetical protein